MSEFGEPIGSAAASLLHEPGVDQQLGNNVARARERKGWTQRQLAELTGMKRTTITNIETGLQSTNARQIVVLTATLGEQILPNPLINQDAMAESARLQRIANSILSAGLKETDS